jgi:lipoprotein-releasing system ATP-binding protein
MSVGTSASTTSASTTTTSGPLLRAEGLSKSFFKGKVEIPVLRDVTFSMSPGEMVAITGASGVGKSTLLHILGTLEKPTRGQVFFAGSRRNLFDLSEAEVATFRNRALGFIFQFHYLLPEFTALENVMMPAWIAGVPRDTAKKQALELLDFVGLSHRLEHRPGELSGGEQQRVAVARSVILRPKLLLADELTGNLDSANSSHVIDLLTKLNQTTGISVLLVTHDSLIASRMHRVMPMKDGRFLN